MKPVATALLVGTLIGSVLTGLTYLSSADASGSAGESIQVAATAPAVAVAATPAPVYNYIGELTADAVPIPENVDPILGGRRRGLRSSKVSGALGHGVRADYNVDIENYEHARLTDQQSTQLLKIFRNADGVRRLIDQYGGDPDDTHYWVRRIHANEDGASPNNPWVTATLRADFASPEGVRGIEMEVYRRKNAKGQLDNTPYVSQTQIAYLERGGFSLSNTLGYRHDDDEEFAIAHDTLETIYYED